MAKKSRNKPFKDWQYEEVNEAFGLSRKFSHPLFDTFAAMSLADDHPKRAELDSLRNIAREYIDSWNEDEYKFMFISPFIRLANFVSPHYKVFTQRPMSVKYDNDTKTTDGLVEFMLAKGIQMPRKPHFFLHEYKPEKRRDNDPLGQLLIAMAAAQKLNKDNNRIYGIYVNGRNWFWVLLEGQTYATSAAYDIASDEIFQLFATLAWTADEMEKMYQ